MVEIDLLKEYEAAFAEIQTDLTNCIHDGRRAARDSMTRATAKVRHVRPPIFQLWWRSRSATPRRIMHSLGRWGWIRSRHPARRWWKDYCQEQSKQGEAMVDQFLVWAHPSEGDEVEVLRRWHRLLKTNLSQVDAMCANLKAFMLDVTWTWVQGEECAAQVFTAPLSQLSPRMGWRIYFRKRWIAGKALKHFQQAEAAARTREHLFSPLHLAIRQVERWRLVFFRGLWPSRHDRLLEAAENCRTLLQQPVFPQTDRGDLWCDVGSMYWHLGQRYLDSGTHDIAAWCFHQCLRADPPPAYAEFAQWWLWNVAAGQN